MADLFLCGGRVLESRWGRFIWFSYQPTNCALLHARTEHDPVARSYCFVWCLWHARNRAYAVLPQRADRATCVENWSSHVCLLGDERRAIINGDSQSSPDWITANLGQCRARFVVCTLGGVSAHRHDEHLTLVTNDRGHDLRLRHPCLGLVCPWS